MWIVPEDRFPVWVTLSTQQTARCEARKFHNERSSKTELGSGRMAPWTARMAPDEGFMFQPPLVVPEIAGDLPSTLVLERVYEYANGCL